MIRLPVHLQLIEETPDVPQFSLDRIEPLQDLSFRGPYIVTRLIKLEPGEQRPMIVGGSLSRQQSSGWKRISDLPVHC